jgi:hypothetical protein
MGKVNGFQPGENAARRGGGVNNKGRLRGYYLRSRSLALLRNNLQMMDKTRPSDKAISEFLRDCDRGASRDL